MKKIIQNGILLMVVLFLLCACGNQKENDVYTFQYQNQNIILGDSFTREKYGNEIDYAESPSCAFVGLDKTYRYDHYEITTYPNQEEDLIYSIYFLDEEVATTEGLKIGDEKEKMIEVYGESFEQQNSLYTYRKGKTELRFLLQDDIIFSIEYAYEVE